MAWYRHAASHFLTQCWPSSMVPPDHNKFKVLRYPSVTSDVQNLWSLRTLPLWDVIVILNIIFTPLLSPRLPEYPLLVWTGSQDPLYQHELTLIPAWISNHLPSKVWNEIAHPFPNLSGTTIEVWERISNFIPQFIVGVITYPCQ